MDKAAFLRENADYGYGYGHAADVRSQGVAPSSPHRLVDELRRDEFPQMQDCVYLDHAGATLHSKSQLEKAFQELQNGVYGNPHSQTMLHPTSESPGRDTSIDAIRRRVLRFFHAPEDEYEVIFTSGATAGLKLVGECFPWTTESEFAHSMDSHTSVLGVRRYATHLGANVSCVSLEDMYRMEADARNPAPAESSADLRCTSDTASATHSHFHLFAFPAECNFSGTVHSLELVDKVQKHGLSGQESLQSGRWLVLLDAAKFVATHPLDLSTVRPDFVVMSFYKMFGYPTGVGALIVRREVLSILRKPYYGGGTVSNVLATRDFAHLKMGHDATRFEDGTVSYLSIRSLRHGLDMLEKKFTMHAIERHTTSLTRLLRDRLQNSAHWNGARAALIYAPSPTSSTVDSGGLGFRKQSSITTCNFLRPDGSYVGFAEVNKLAAIHNIHLRTGCFCNPGACQWYLGLSESDLLDGMAAGHVCGDDVDLVNGRPTGAVRISVGYMTTYEDVMAFADFVSKYFVVQTPTDKEIAARSPVHSDLASRPATLDDHGNKDSHGIVLRKLTLFPIKSCAGMNVNAWPVGSRGLLYDREWAIVDAATRKALTLKDAPELCFLRPWIDLETSTLRISCPHKTVTTLVLPLEGDMVVKNSTSRLLSSLWKGRFGPCQSSNGEEELQVCAARCTGMDVGDHVSTWLSEVLQRTCRLVRVATTTAREAVSTASPSPPPPSPPSPPEAAHLVPSPAKIGFANQAQFLLISRASVAAVNAALLAADADVTVQEDAFRANLIVDGCTAFAEDTWRGLRMEDDSHSQRAAMFAVSGPCSRCSMVNIDPVTGAFHRAPLQVLSRFRRDRAHIYFGQFLTYTTGMLSCPPRGMASPPFASFSSAMPPQVRQMTWLHVGAKVDIEVS